MSHEFFSDVTDGVWTLAAMEEDDDVLAEIDAVLERGGTEHIVAVDIDQWPEMYEYGPEPIVAKLTAEAHRFPALRRLGLGDVDPEMCEISWIQLGDITPLLTAFPNLERLDLRGSDGLALAPLRHDNLRVLRVECGGLHGSFVRQVAACDLPALEHLELWLGVERYGGNTSVGDLAPILSGDRLPALRHLGLQDSEIQDEIAAAVASAPVVARLDELDLSMGTLTDTGAEALLDGQPLSHLKVLDLHHNFLSDAMADRVEKALPGVDVRLHPRLSPRDDRFYVAVSE
ncbi:STM4015 family protein [Herbidospora cretacea]|uniref:STM4015 family protein n=1 Tax=Herbidospora cretacea TaxID=28444 RepID=UPI000774D6F6|nr:STM4015 family protein [Herbidospora cretacea]